MISSFRKKQISDLADFISESFSEEFVTNVESILENEGIYLHEDHYGNAFDGSLVFDEKNYHIHINKDKGNYTNSVRGRFTIAHELGHYFLEDHHKNLVVNEPHFSSFNLDNSNLIEEEADFFAACLLFPYNKFRATCNAKKISAELIYEISNTFKASKIATIKRFCEIGSHEIFVVYSKDNSIKWYDRSKDFPYMKFKFSIGSNPPIDTLAKDFFENENLEFTQKVETYSGDWFYTENERKMYEQCLGSREYNYIVSLLWFD